MRQAKESEGQAAAGGRSSLWEDRAREEVQGAGRFGMEGTKAEVFPVSLAVCSPAGCHPLQPCPLHLEADWRMVTGYPATQGAQPHSVRWFGDTLCSSKNTTPCPPRKHKKQREPVFDYAVYI